MINRALLIMLFSGLTYSLSYAFPDTLWLNSRSSATISSSALANGIIYEIEITGTHTKWGSSNWSQGACSGSEPIAIFPNGANTKVGRDIFFRFGGPTCCTNCPNTQGTHSDPRFSIDGAAPGLNFNTLAGPLTYSPTHIYTANVTGQGQALRSRFVDSYYSDNSGRYRIVIREAPVNSVPTVSQWGLVLLGLSLLCMGAIVLHQLQYSHGRLRKV